jgi:hypothetical protein
LNLESNRLGDKAVKLLCEAVVSNTSLRKLNLSGNYITSSSCEAIKDILLNQRYLAELYLHWNQIKPDGGQLVLDGLLENQTIRVFDFAWNTLGGDVPGIIEKLTQIIKEKTNIVHMDLSCNNFSLSESKKIAAALVDNKTIYGFHFRGNFGYIDTKGFLIVDDNTLKEAIDPRSFKWIRGKQFKSNLKIILLI